MKNILITEDQKKIVLGILRKHFLHEKLYAFGSRATHLSVKPFSDSDLPFKVDLVDLNSISLDFRKNIEADFIELV